MGNAFAANDVLDSGSKATHASSGLCLNSCLHFVHEFAIFVLRIWLLAEVVLNEYVDYISVVVASIIKQTDVAEQIGGLNNLEVNVLEQKIDDIFLALNAIHVQSVPVQSVA